MQKGKWTSRKSVHESAEQLDAIDPRLASSEQRTPTGCGQQQPIVPRRRVGLTRFKLRISSITSPCQGALCPQTTIPMLSRGEKIPRETKTMIRVGMRVHGGGTASGTRHRGFATGESGRDNSLTKPAHTGSGRPGRGQRGGRDGILITIAVSRDRHGRHGRERRQQQQQRGDGEQHAAYLGMGYLSSPDSKSPATGINNTRRSRLGRPGQNANFRPGRNGQESSGQFCASGPAGFEVE